ncbi:hypothetical protein SLG_06580 [Sphingobium sp. SYK-6]|uniref:CmcJ/NvfI family oxidoreductase n=1 Tax=Sphingobium sp. (strain NBRC 103272 / SYK-6) TaxID=627192 RepID=UPI000227690D|nr:CmcJ/NvfI family oxidoreductase [Sphingobium sp. SYK-6]BAK65333.1 hypothetical protein SLG_06580 [Sphingobium sp. SYK-6]
MAVRQIDIEESVRSVEAALNYLLPGPDINRRFVSAGVEVNTGRYGPFVTTIRDGRAIRDHFSFDRQGFRLLDAPTQVRDFSDTAEIDRVYPAEVEGYVREAFGADLVVPMGWMIRTSGEVASRQKKRDQPYRHQGGVQPPAGEVHVDTEPSRQLAAARRTYDRVRPGGPGFRRFIISSFWRTFSPPPQDCPLALCDARSVSDDEGTPNVLWVVDEIPQGDAMFAPMDDDGQMAAAIFRHNPAHRWWYFSGMTRDEALLFKFHDSDRSVGWRTPHTAFWDDSLPGAHPRESIELRSIAFFE